MVSCFRVVPPLPSRGPRNRYEPAIRKPIMPSESRSALKRSPVVLIGAGRDAADRDNSPGYASST